MKLYYDHPAENWHESLPLGNGRIGAMVYGGTKKEILALNEDTLWSGYPEKTQKKLPEGYLEKVRELTEKREYQKAMEYLEECFSSSEDVQMYVPFGNVYMEMLDGTEEISDYHRELCLDTAEVRITYKNQGALVEKSCIVSQPAQVLVYKIRSEKAFSLKLYVEGGYARESCCTDGILKTKGQCPGRVPFTVGEGGSEKAVPVFPEEPEKQGMCYEGWGKIVTDGKVNEAGNAVIVENAEEVTLYYGIRSSFAGFDRHPVIEGRCPEELLKADFDCTGKSYEALRTEHLKEYQKYYKRVSFSLGEKDEYAEKDLRQRLTDFQDHPEDVGLNALLFQYGRYLLIAASRPGTQAANLQGIWNHHMRAPWSSNYTVNINTEMNYWMAEKANLSDCHMPLLELIERTSKKGEKTAQDVYHLAGWVSHHNLDIWGHSSPVGQFGQDENPCTYSMWPMSSGWLCCHLWEHYCYTLDEAFLKKKAFPIIQGAVEFYLGYLVPYKGYYVTAPSTSPENTFLAPDMTTHSVTFASTMDISILRELFGLYLKACEILGVEDFTNAVKNVLQKLPPYKIGKEGQLQEWFYDYPEADINHRHISHLFGLYPGNQIHKENEPLIEACRTSLERRGDKGTGWCMAWKACLWAKLGDGNHALTLLKNQLRLTREEACSLVGGGIYPNMLCAHPPFQIDGNFGFAAAVLEMLVQYEEQKIVFLPALPDEWKDGMAEGVKAPGNITLNFKWKEKRVTEINLKSPIDAKLVILYNGMEEEIVLNAGSSYQKTLI